MDTQVDIRDQRIDLLNAAIRDIDKTIHSLKLLKKESCDVEASNLSYLQVKLMKEKLRLLERR